MEKTPNDFCETEEPSDQTMVNAMGGWVTHLPLPEVVSGGANLFDDARVRWALGQFDGCDGKSVLELGPLEGGNTCMLHRAGAKYVIAVEANRNCFLKCLITKELFNLENASFRCGDFMPMLENRSKEVPYDFDIVFAAGVLYHMADPLRLLRLVSKITNQLYIWTHYIPDEGYTGGWPVEMRDCDGREVAHYINSYGTAGDSPAYCGGVYTKAAWLRRADILNELKLLGFNQLNIGMDNLDHPNGPAFSVAAIRTKK